MARNIAGIQQIGIGVLNVDEAFNWYREIFGTDVQVFKDSAKADLMINYTGNKVHSRTAALALNMAGGGGFEIWQYTSRIPQPATFAITLNTTGIIAARIKSSDINKTFAYFKSKNVNIISPISVDAAGIANFWITDPYKNMFQIIEDDVWFQSPKNQSFTGGVAGAIIVVTDMEKAMKFYANILNYTTILSDTKAVSPELSGFAFGDKALRRVSLMQPKHTMAGPFSRLLGSSKIELIETPDVASSVQSFKDRQWGDLGYIHLCYDITDQPAHEALCAKAGYPFTVNSDSKFEMGDAAGQFSYNEDPDGTLIEYVHTFKVPILKKWNLYLDLRKRNQSKPLPNWMVNTLRFNKVK